MRVLVDSSAFLAVMDVDEQNHVAAKRIWEQLIRNNAILICTNYVLLETLALIQRRFGLALVKAFQENVVPFLNVEWVDEPLHQAGVAALLTANRRHLSLVDCISFEIARRLGIDTVFAFDQLFVEQGFTCLS
ncbi:MAG: PIN domain-containing protein [Chloroflexi bacterium]|nr:PIN domain-containing protein [Chloroflexota bacterium]